MSDRPPSTPVDAGPHPESRPGTRAVAGVSPGSLFRSPTLLLLLVIVVGSVSLMAAGFGTPPPATDANESEAPLGGLDDSPDVGDGNGGGDGAATATRTDAGPPSVRLSLSMNRSDPRPGQAALVTVRADGEPVADALVSVRGDTYRTNASGQVVVRFAAGGEATLEATKAADDVDYQRATTTVTVRRYVVPLSVSANATRATAGDAVAFTVRTANGTAPAGVTVDGTTYRTGSDGVAVVRMERAGAFTARATKARNATVRYTTAETDVAVERREVPLDATVGDDDVVAGERVAVTVRSTETGAPLPGANVTLDGVRYRTNASGVAVVPFERARTATLRASAPQTAAVRYLDATVTVDVRRRTVPLSLTATPSSVETNGTVTYRVTRADTGDPVNATLRVDDRTYAAGDDGVVNVTLSGYGRRTARATLPRTPAERYVPDAVGVTVLAPDFAVTNLTLPANVTAGEELVVAATVSNVGNAQGSSTVAVRLAGETRATTQVTLLPSETERVRVNVTVSADASGETPVEVVELDPVVGAPDGANGTVTVDAPRFVVGDLAAPSSAEAGETITVAGTVRNTGTAAGNATVTYRLAGESVASTRVSLSPGGIDRVRLTVTVPADLDPGTYDQALVTADDAVTTTLQVRAGDESAAVAVPAWPGL